MKRMHRRWQVRAWCALTPVVAAVITLALLSRCDVAANAEWPVLLMPVSAAGDG